MQPKARANQTKILINDKEYPSLFSCSALDSNFGEIEAQSPGSIETISNGQRKWTGLDIIWLDRNDSDVANDMYNYHDKQELVDITYVELDGHGIEVRRWLIADAAVTRYQNIPFSSAGIDKAQIISRFVFDGIVPI